MSLISRIGAALAAGQMANSVQALPPTQLYQMLKAFYFSNDLYSALSQSRYDRVPRMASEPLKPLRNPTFRVVEFYCSHIWPGSLPDALPIVADNAAIIPAIHQVWKWSNWGAQRQVAIRQLAMLGDLFIKVVQTVDRKQVYFQLIDAEHVTDFDTDHRGFLTRIRVDTPQIDKTGKSPREWTYTEVWDKGEQSLRVWKHDRGDAPLDQLGSVAEEVPLRSFGIDFVPFVHVQFRDVGEARGMAAIMPALDKIDEANRQATRLSQMVFRYGRPVWALSANSLDKSGRPVPAPLLSDSTGESTDSLTLDQDTMLRLPGMATLQSLVPNVNYADSLAILQDTMRELQNDLPELAYYELRDLGALSGRAVRLLLSAAIARAYEVRGNAEVGLIQADEMALTMMAGAGLGVNGSFDAGDFSHAFAHRDVIAVDELEQAQGELAQAQATQAWTTSGMPFSEALRRVPGYSEEDIVRIMDAKAAEMDTGDAEEVPAVER
jgi:hypothetical protein